MTNTPSAAPGAATISHACPRRLFLTGADVGSPGVDGAMMAGVMTAARLLGPLGMPRLMARAYARQ